MQLTLHTQCSMGNISIFECNNFSQNSERKDAIIFEKFQSSCLKIQHKGNLKKKGEEEKKKEKKRKKPTTTLQQSNECSLLYLFFFSFFLSSFTHSVWERGSLFQLFEREKRNKPKYKLLLVLAPSLLILANDERCESY